MISSNISLSDGRVLAVHEFGDAEGQPCFFFHGGGVGATGIFAATCDTLAEEYHIRIVAPDRPGIGESSRQLGRTILDWPNDVAELAEALHIDRFAVVSHSGGTAYALACAWRLSERVINVNLVSAVAPRSFISNEKQIPLKTKFSMWMFALLPNWMMGILLRQMAVGLGRHPEKTYRSFLRRLPFNERQTLDTPSYLKHIQTCAAAAFRQGTAGVVEDLSLIFGPWGVAFQEIVQPVTLWHGECDRTAPPEIGHSLSRAIPHAELRTLPDEGHLSAWFDRSQEILANTLK